jgi:peptidyl-prolyl cis-trans isomerase C
VLNGRFATKRLFILSLSLCLVATLGLTGCQQPSATAPNSTSSVVPSGNAGDKVATIDGVVVTKGDYDKLYTQFGRMLNMGADPKQASNPVVGETLKRLTLNQLILNTLVKKDAAALGVSVTDELFNKLKEQQIKQLGGKEAFTGFLAQNKVDEAQFDSSLRDQLLLNQFLEKKGGASVKVSEAEVSTFYNQHLKDFNIPETVRAKHILVKAIEPELKRELKAKSPNLTPDELTAQIKAEKVTLKAKADQLAKEVQASPTKFSDIAQKNSDDVVSAKNGGDLGPLTQRDLDPVFWDAIHKTKPGTLYPGVLETQFGYHIIEVLDHGKPHQMALAEAKPIILSRLEGEKKQKVMETWVTAKKAEVAKKIVIEPAYRPIEAKPPAGQPPMPGGMQPPAGGPAMAPPGAGPAAGPMPAPAPAH